MTRRERPWEPGIPCWTDLSTPDPEVARAFYGAVLGWEFEVGGPEHGGYAVARLGGAAVAGVAPLMGPGQRTGWGLFLATDDAGATARAARAAGGTVVAGPLDVPGRGRMLLVADPAGAVTGAWQHGPFIGAELVNEPGALVWEDLRSGDPAASRAFLSAVFGLAHDAFPGAPGDYQLARLPSESAPVGGVGPLFGSPSPEWLVYFAVADADGAVAAATAGGGALAQGPGDSPFGRSAVLADPAGARFAVIQPPEGSPRPDRS